MSETSNARWRAYNWELLRDTARAPQIHMAIDDLLLDQVASGTRAPTLRMWEWAASAVVIGRFQSLRNEVDPDGAQRHAIEVVRRITGGGAMFIEPGNTITYSVYAPEELVRGMSAAESYAYLDGWVLAALATLGVQAWYQPINDITSAAGKIGGAAQTRRRGAVLHHVTMAYDIDTSKMLAVLRIGREKLSDKGTASAAKRVDPLRSQTGLPRAAVVVALVETFRTMYGLRDAQLSDDDLDTARALVETKFGSAQWIGIVP